MIMEKVTIKAQVAEIAQKFNEGVALTDEDVRFLIERAEKSIRKASAKPTESKAHKENVVLGEQVMALLTEKGSVTAKDVQEFLDVSNQKASAVMKALGDKVVKTERKGKNPVSWAIAE